MWLNLIRFSSITYQLILVQIGDVYAIWILFCFQSLKTWNLCFWRNFYRRFFFRTCKRYYLYSSKSPQNKKKIINEIIFASHSKAFNTFQWHWFVWKIGYYQLMRIVMLFMTSKLSAGEKRNKELFASILMD